MPRSIVITCAVLLCGLPAAGDFQISPSDGASHSYPSVCRQPAGFVAAWESGGADGREITVQRLDDSGRPSGPTSRANLENAGDQQLPDIACRADGSFLVVWESPGQDGDGLGVFARNFNADGSAASNEFQVNSYTLDHQRNARVCAGADGRAVVVWQSTGQDGDGTGIYAHIYDADAISVGTELQIHRDTAGNQSAPAIACANDGQRLVAWTHQRGNDSEILARVLRDDGTLDERIARVSSDEVFSARAAAASALQGSGEFVVALETERAKLELATLTLPSTGEAAVSVRALQFDGRNEAPAIASNASDAILLAWAQGSGFDFDVAGLRMTSSPGAPDRITSLQQNRAGNDGALSTVGRGIAITTAPDGDLVLWQKRDVIAADSSSAIFAQRFEDCSGDCSADGTVRVNELILAVRIALNQTALDTCASIDRNANGTVEINELIRAVNEALASICPAPVG